MMMYEEHLTGSLWNQIGLRVAPIYPEAFILSLCTKVDGQRKTDDGNHSHEKLVIVHQHHLLRIPGEAPWAIRPVKYDD